MNIISSWSFNLKKNDRFRTFKTSSKFIWTYQNFHIISAKIGKKTIYLPLRCNKLCFSEVESYFTGCQLLWKN